MIKDERYSGVLLYKGKKYTNIVPPIVTKSIQNKAIDSLKVGRSRKNYRYIYDNIIYCANCNKVMTGTSGKGRNKIYYYYQCKECNGKISQEQINEVISTKKYRMIKDGQKAEIKEIDKKRYSLNRRIKNLRERYLYKKITEREFCSLIIPRG